MLQTAGCQEATAREMSSLPASRRSDAPSGHRTPRGLKSSLTAIRCFQASQNSPDCVMNVDPESCVPRGTMTSQQLEPDTDPSVAVTGVPHPSPCDCKAVWTSNFTEPEPSPPEPAQDTMLVVYFEKYSLVFMSGSDLVPSSATVKLYLPSTTEATVLPFAARNGIEV